MRRVHDAARSNRAFMTRALSSYRARVARGEPADRSILAHLVRSLRAAAPRGWMASNRREALRYAPRRPFNRPPAQRGRCC
jgi:hypothetical protein